VQYADHYDIHDYELQDGIKQDVDGKQGYAPYPDVEAAVVGIAADDFSLDELPDGKEFDKEQDFKYQDKGHGHM